MPIIIKMDYLETAGNYGFLLVVTTVLHAPQIYKLLNYINQNKTLFLFPRYQLIGESERTCTNNQQWSHAPPECKCISCPILALDNGRIETADENKVGT